MRKLNYENMDIDRFFFLVIMIYVRAHYIDMNMDFRMRSTLNKWLDKTAGFNFN